ncbi:MAG TPA: serine/threonine-protein kinase, partial [Candidatus Polarisedimenticolia bacterium]|nr:serine/threonine-protein kinase [Candidatus Polarisedimenticolia bacterium]
MTPVSGEATRPGSADHHSPPPSQLSLDARFPPGTLLAGRYRIVGLLGRGGMGEVFRADDLKLARPVALKFLPGELERDPYRLGRLLDEVRIALRVSHPNVCRVHDVGEIDGAHFISMEYVDGENLDSLLRRIGRLPQDKAIQAARQLCAGLAAAHDQGILHRDLKPANVMLDGRGQVKVTDFGLAGLAGEVRGDDVGAGTPAYMAPEQLAGTEVTTRSDLYALGLLLYEIFTGKPAFDAATRARAASGRQTPPARLSSHVHGIDPAVERVIMRCLEPDPADRPASAQAVAAALPGGDPLAAALAAGETPSPRLVAEAGPSGRLKPSLAVACLAGGIAAMGIVIALSPRILLVGRVPLGKPPEALAEKARDAIRAAGWSAPPADSLFGFIPNWPYLEELRESASSGDPWEPLRAARPPGVFFGYRQSPQPLARQYPGVLGDWFRDPPPTLEGMVEVRLDVEGRLVFFAAVPSDVDPALPGAEPDWAPLFAAAGLDPNLFVDADPSWMPRSYADRRVAWKGPYPGGSGSVSRVDAASYRGRPISFVVQRVLGVQERAQAANAPPLGFWARAKDLVNSLWFVIVIVGATLVAVRNVRLGRGDRSGALRLAAYLGGARMLFMIGAHHIASRAELDLLRGHLAWTLYYVGLAYVLYLALEPYARKLWPPTLVSWVRLLNGRFRDPLVGRDLLIGVTYGSVHALIVGLTKWSYQVLGLAGAPLEAGSWSLEALRGLPQAVTSVVATHSDSVLFALFGIMMFLVLRVLLRRTWAAVAAWAALAVVLFNPGSGNPWPYLCSILILFPLFWIVFFRVGLLAVITGLSLSFLLHSLPLTYDPTAWYSGVTLMVILPALGVAVWGYSAVTAGRPIFRDEVAAP